MKTERQSSSDRRLSLLQAALDLFSSQGYAGTTTKAIAKDSGVTEAILFRHFRTKEELLRAVVEQFSPRPLFPPPPSSIHALPTRQGIELLLKRYLDAVWINRVFLSMVFTTPKREQAVFEPIWAEFTAEGIYLYTFLKKRSEQNEVKSHLVIAAADVISAATSGYIQRVLYDAPEDWVAARDMFVSNLLEVLFGGIE